VKISGAVVAMQIFRHRQRIARTFRWGL
jgi:uncharacterized membrane protein YsdA (DUF1294 family)